MTGLRIGAVSVASFGSASGAKFWDWHRASSDSGERDPTLVKLVYKCDSDIPKIVMVFRSCGKIIFGSTVVSCCCFNLCLEKGNCCHVGHIISFAMCRGGFVP